MKDFLKMTLAVIVGMIVLSIVSTVLCLGIFGTMAAVGNAAPSIPKSGVLTIDLSQMQVVEQTEEYNPLNSIYAREDVSKVGMLDAATALNKAAADPAVEFVYLKCDGNSTGLAHLSEFRRSLENFRKSGKPVVAYTESPSTGSYYLASVADKVLMTSHPGSMISITGIGVQMVFIKDLLDKLGVNVQLIRHGKYKSAGEMFIRSDASAENLEQNQVMVDSMWKSVASEIAQSRGISTEALDSLIDGLKLVLPEDLLSAGLVDELVTRDQLEGRLADISVKDDFKDVEMIDFVDYVNAKVLPGKARKKIAVIYADGNIVEEDDDKQVSGDRFASVIRKVRRDSTVKAVVLRVNSPGGSVIASDKIKAELDLLKGEKPLVASYGEYAASGGYWISANADKIFCDAVTLTGSIGVFSIIPDFSKTARNIAHVNFTSVTSNRHGDLYSTMKPLDAEEQDYMLRSVEDIYDRFTSLVASARSMEQSAVDEIAQGRVWTGTDALAIGLVDEIGTLEDAVAYAAVCAGNPDLAQWNVKGYPKPAGPMDELMRMFGERNDDGVSVLLRRFGDLTKVRTEARMPYEITVIQ